MESGTWEKSIVEQWRLLPSKFGVAESLIERHFFVIKRTVYFRPFFWSVVNLTRMMGQVELRLCIYTGEVQTPKLHTTAHTHTHSLTVQLENDD